MARVVVLHHLEHPFLGHAGEALRAAGVEIDERDLLHGDSLPAPGESEAILSLGGDQSVRDLERYPYLVAEVEHLGVQCKVLGWEAGCRKDVSLSSAFVSAIRCLVWLGVFDECHSVCGGANNTRSY